MLISVVVELDPQSDEPLPLYTGHKVHGWFFRWLTRVDAKFASSLHRLQRKPFTVSGLHSNDRSTWFRLTSLTDDMSSWLLTHLDRDMPNRISINRRNYDVSAVDIAAQQHPWARQATYHQLKDRYLDGSDDGNQVRLRFHSPTTFRSQGVNVPLPRPDLVFGSLADRWAAFSPILLDDAIRIVSDGQVVVSRYHLKTSPLHIVKGPPCGFGGVCYFEVLSKNWYWQQVCHLLAEFAFYSGVGYKTAQGMGQAQRL